MCHLAVGLFLAAPPVACPGMTLHIFVQNPVRPVRTYADLRIVLMQRIVLSTLQFRINNRYKVRTQNP